MDEISELKDEIETLKKQMKKNREMYKQKLKKIKHEHEKSNRHIWCFVIIILFGLPTLIGGLSLALSDVISFFLTGYVSFSPFAIAPGGFLTFIGILILIACAVAWNEN